MKTKQQVTFTTAQAIDAVLKYGREDAKLDRNMSAFFKICTIESLTEFNAGIAGHVDQPTISRLNNIFRVARHAAKKGNNRLPCESHLTDEQSLKLTIIGLEIDTRKKVNSKAGTPAGVPVDASAIVGKSETVTSHVDYKAIISALPSLTNSELQKLSQTIEALKNERLAAKTTKKPATTRKTGTK